MDTEDPKTIVQSWFTIKYILWTVLCASLLLEVIRRYLKYRQWADMVDLIPGPKKLPILGNAIQVAASRTDVAKRIDGRFATFGPIFRIWFGPMPTVALSRAEDIEIVLNSTKHLEKSFFYNFVKPWLGDGLLLSSGAKWHAHRKLITPTFHFNILEIFHEVFKAKTKILMERLDKHSDTKKPFEIYSYISQATLDVICETAMGTNINAQTDKQSDYVKSIYDISQMLTYRTRRFWLYPNIIYHMTKGSQIYRRSLKILHEFAADIISERRTYRKETMSNSDDNKKSADNDPFDGKRRKVAFLDVLLEAEEKGARLSETSIREEVDTFMFEGHDTTATGISWCLFLLGHNQDCQQRVYEELESMYHGNDSPITIEDLGEMKYLERVIKEAMRIYPPVPLIGRKLDEDTKIGNYIVPAGISLGIFIYHLHRDERFFPDPERFDPDRFLPENCKNRHPYAYLPFSAGSRNCIGQKFAMMEEKVLLASILRKYKVTSVDKPKDLNLLYELVLRTDSGLNIVLEKR